jgi:cell division inhibitor SulA
MALEAIVFFKSLHNFLFLILSHSRMHSYITNQLQAPIYRNMETYARYAAKLVTPQSSLLYKWSSVPSWNKNCKMQVCQENNR